MIVAALTVLALMVGGLVVEICTAARAPLGYQDEAGFHLGVRAHEHPRDGLSEEPS
jgi:hypothetical protein